MADEFQVGSGNWWDSSRQIPSSSAMDSGAPSVSGSSNNILMYQETQKRLQGPDSSTASILTADSDMQMMGLGLSSQHQTIDWSSNLLRDGGKTESTGGFRSLLQEDQSRISAPSNFYHPQDQWRQQPKLYSGPGADSEDSTGNDFKQTNQPDQFNSSVTEVAASYPSDPTVGYGSPSTILLQGLLAASDQDNRQQSTLTGDYPFPTNYGLNSGDMMSAPWSKFPQFMRNSPPPHPQLQFSNNINSFWNSPVNTEAAGSPGFFQSVQPPPFPPPANFEEKPKINPLEDRDLGGAPGKKNNTTEASSYKRARSDATPISHLPAFKVRKEKMGDRITALQQLVSPFGKTDTASVLSEAIEYIKFLHEQVTVLSTPYMKIGASMQQQQQHEIIKKSKVVDPEENDDGAKWKDLRSLGLCLVPVSSTFPVTHEQTVDYWNPTFGGSFR